MILAAPRGLEASRNAAVAGLGGIKADENGFFNGKIGFSQVFDLILLQCVV